MLVIADGEKPVVIAGIMGGVNSGVSAETTELVIETAIFKRQTIRATSKRLGLSSDSSYRYERGVDAHQLGGRPVEAEHVELAVAVAGDQVVEVAAVGVLVAFQVHRHEAGELHEARIDAPARA